MFNDLSNEEDINIGVHAFILNNNNEILLSERLKAVEYGSFSLPAGHVQKGETIEAAIIREMKEELGINIIDKDLKVVCVAKNDVYVNFGILIQKYEGKIKNNELDKVGILNYYSLGSLPNLFSGSKGLIELYKNKEFYNSSFNS